jgi:hypothetical protein
MCKMCEREQEETNSVTSSWPGERTSVEDTIQREATTVIVKLLAVMTLC